MPFRLQLVKGFVAIVIISTTFLSVLYPVAQSFDLVTAAVSHLAASTKADQILTVSFMNDWTNEHIAGYQPRSQDSVGAAPSRPGLGVEVDIEQLGEPLFSV